MIQQIPWIERKFDFDFPVGMFPIIVERLKGTQPKLETMLKNINNEKLSRKDGQKWSIKEQVGHLCDAEESWYQRIENYFSGKQTIETADINIIKTEQTDHNTKSIGELLKQFSYARNKLIDKVENMDEATASITAFHPRLQKPMRLIDSLFVVAEHDDQHLAKIRELLK